MIVLVNLALNLSFSATVFCPCPLGSHTIWYVIIVIKQSSPWFPSAAGYSLSPILVPPVSKPARKKTSRGTPPLSPPPSCSRVPACVRQAAAAGNQGDDCFVTHLLPSCHSQFSGSRHVPVQPSQGAVPHQDLAPQRLLRHRRHLPRHPEGPGTNCIKIGLPGKSILRDYTQFFL